MRLFRSRAKPACKHCRDRPRRWPKQHCHACGNGLLFRAEDAYSSDTVWPEVICTKCQTHQLQLTPDPICRHCGGKTQAR